MKNFYFRRKVGSFIDSIYENFMPDALYLKRVFPRYLGYPLDLQNPKTFNAKLQWLKIHDKHDEYSRLVDKFAVKDYVREKAGCQYVIPTIGVWDKVNDVDFDALPNQFVIKCTHDSGSVVVCKNKSELDVNKTKDILIKGLSNKKGYAVRNKEYPYKGVVPKIIAEDYLEDASGKGLIDYKFFCFNGEPKFLFVATDRQDKNEETKFDFFDLNWNHLPVTNGHPNNPVQPLKPTNFEEMCSVARQLSIHIPHVRIDLYNVDGAIYFGEMTFFHWSGFVPFKPEKWDYEFGNYLVLPKI